MESVTVYKGVEYRHSDYTTAVKRKNLPEQVKKAILGKNYKAPIEQIPDNDTE